MNQFYTIKDTEALFKKVDALGEENCFFLSSKKMHNIAIIVTIIGAFLGSYLFGIIIGILLGIVLGVICTLITNKLEKGEKFDGYLINQTEKGIGLIPLKYKDFSSQISAITVGALPEKMVAQLDKFFFIEKEKIESISIRTVNLKMKNVTIKLVNNENIGLTINNKFKSIPYHEENFSKFVNKYKK